MSIIGGSLCGHRPLTTRPLGAGRSPSRESETGIGYGSSSLPKGGAGRARASPAGGRSPPPNNRLRAPAGGPTGTAPVLQIPSHGAPGSPLPGSPGASWSISAAGSGPPSVVPAPVPTQTELPSGLSASASAATRGISPSGLSASASAATSAATRGISQSKRRSLTADLPDPDSIQKQKEGHSQTIESQLRDGADSLGATHKQKADYLHALANQQKHQFNIMLDQQVKEQELALSKQYQNDLVRMQQAAQERRAQLECQAAALTLEWQQRKTAEEFLRQNDGIEQQYSQAQEQIEKAIEQFGRDPSSLAVASAQMMPTVIPMPVAPKKASSFGGSPVATYSTPLTHMTSSSVRVPGPASRMQYIPPPSTPSTTWTSYTPRSGSRQITSGTRSGSATPLGRSYSSAPTPRMASPHSSYVPPDGLNSPIQALAPTQQYMRATSPKKLSYVPPSGTTVSSPGSPGSSYVPVVRQTSRGTAGQSLRSVSPGGRMSVSSSRAVLSPPTPLPGSLPSSVTVAAGAAVAHRAVAVAPQSLVAAPSGRTSIPATGVASPKMPVTAPVETVSAEEVMYAPPPNLSNVPNRRLEYVPPPDADVNGA